MSDVFMNFHLYATWKPNEMSLVSIIDISIIIIIIQIKIWMFLVSIINILIIITQIKILPIRILLVSARTKLTLLGEVYRKKCA